MLYVSEKDVVVVGEQGVTAHFKAGVERSLRASLVDKAKALGVKAVSKPVKPATRASSTKTSVADEG
jgi:hypothetical protein